MDTIHEQSTRGGCAADVMLLSRSCANSLTYTGSSRHRFIRKAVALMMCSLMMPCGSHVPGNALVSYIVRHSSSLLGFPFHGGLKCGQLWQLSTVRVRSRWTKKIQNKRKKSQSQGYARKINDKKELRIQMDTIQQQSRWMRGRYATQSYMSQKNYGRM